MNKVVATLFILLVSVSVYAAETKQTPANDNEDVTRCDIFHSVAEQIVTKINNNEDVPKEEMQALYRIYAEMKRECVQGKPVEEIRIDDLLESIPPFYKKMYGEELDTNISTEKISMKFSE